MVCKESSASTSRPSFPIPDLQLGFTPARHHNQLPQGTRPSVSIYDVVGEIRHLIAVWWWWDDVDDNNSSILQNQPTKWISQKMAPDRIFTWYISRESPLCYSLILPFESETFKVLGPVRPDPKHLNFHDTFPHCYGSHVWIISSSGTYSLEYFCGIFSQIFISYSVLLVSSTGSFQEANKQTFLIHISLPSLPLQLSPFYSFLLKHFSKGLWEKAMAPHSSTLAWKIPWAKEPGRLQSMESLGVGHDWATSLSLFTSCIGEGNGNPLQCSCLENPREGGAWWAAVYGVTQSWTQLKQLSRSSSKGLYLLLPLSPLHSLLDFHWSSCTSLLHWTAQGHQWSPCC